jgi:hypothetical protein
VGGVTADQLNAVEEPVVFDAVRFAGAAVGFVLHGLADVVKFPVAALEEPAESVAFTV